MRWKGKRGKVSRSFLPRLSAVSNLARKPPPKETFSWSLNTESLHLCVARILIPMFIAPTWHRSMTLKLLGDKAMHETTLKARRRIKISLFNRVKRFDYSQSSTVSDDFRFHAGAFTRRNQLWRWASFQLSTHFSGRDAFTVDSTFRFQSSHFHVIVNFLQLFISRTQSSCLRAFLRVDEVVRKHEKCQKNVCALVIAGRKENLQPFLAANGTISLLCWEAKSFQLLQPDVLFMTRDKSADLIQHKMRSMRKE